MNLKSLTGVGNIAGIVGLLLCLASGALRLLTVQIIFQHRTVMWFFIGSALMTAAILIKVDALSDHKH